MRQRGVKETRSAQNHRSKVLIAVRAKWLCASSLLRLEARQATLDEFELGLVGQRPVENTVLDLDGHLANGDVRHAQARVTHRRLLLDEVVWEVIAEIGESGELPNLLCESKSIRREARATWMVEIRKQDEPFAPVERDCLEHINCAHSTESMKKDALAGLRFELGKVSKLADWPIDRDGIGFDEPERAGAVRVFVVGRGGLDHFLHDRIEMFQLELLVFNDAIDECKRLTESFVFFIPAKQV